MAKDTRKVYNKQAIEVNGTNVFFDGKGTPETKTLKVYRYFGDINLMEEAMQNFCIANGYETCNVKL